VLHLVVLHCGTVPYHGITRSKRARLHSLGDQIRDMTLVVRVQGELGLAAADWDVPDAAPRADYLG